MRLNQVSTISGEDQNAVFNKKLDKEKRVSFILSVGKWDPFGYD